MAICAALNASGQVIQQAATALNDCTGFVLLDKADWLQYGMVQGLITIPSGAEFAALWAAGFVVPVTLGLIAYCVGQLVKFWDKD